MNDNTDEIHSRVKHQYERFPYPAGEPDLGQFILSGASQGGCPSRFFHWYWPFARHNDELDILVAGCGTSQAAKYAVRLPKARVTAIDISENSIAHTRMLAEKHNIRNLHVEQLPIESVSSLGRDFDLVISTGVLHHLPDPARGLKELRRATRAHGSLYLMLYGRYGRDGIYYLQDFFRRLGITADNVTPEDLQSLSAFLNQLPPHHPFNAKRHFFHQVDNETELVDLFLHPQDRAYSVPDLYDLLERCGLKMQKLLFRAHYDPRCSPLRATPFYDRVIQLPLPEQFALGELYRVASLMHFFIACPEERPESSYITDALGPDWERLVPIGNPSVTEQAAATGTDRYTILQSPLHQFRNIHMALDTFSQPLWRNIDGQRTLGEILHEAGIPAADTDQLNQGRQFFDDLEAFDYIWWAGRQ